MQDCPSRERLEQLLAKQLDAVESAALERHVERCTTCQNTLEELTRYRLAGGSPDAAERLPPAAREFLQALKETPPSPPLSTPDSDGGSGSVEGDGSEPATQAHGGVALAARPAVAGYEILAEIGRGGMGVVYKARQVKLNRLVALKMILAGGHAGARALARFKTEAEAVARLQHPHVIQIYEVGEHQGLPFLSLEFCPGGSLAAKLQGTPLLPTEAARLVEMLARAVDAAHRQHIVHRDLKPANVLLGSDGQPKVADFGLAKKLDEVTGRTASGAILGTPSYMAPEQAGGEGKGVGPAADIYALGVILFETLTGRPPFKAATDMDTLLQVVREEPVPPRHLQPKVPRDLETIVLKAIAKEPRQRYASAAELAEDLRRFLADRPVRARRASALERLWRWGRRNPALATALGLAVLLVLTVAVSASLFAWTTNRQLQQTQQARDEATERLYRALVLQARGTRRSRGAGQRFDSLAALEQATRLAHQLNLPGDDFLELRNEVIACLALPDVRVAREWDGWPEGKTLVDFDDQLERYALVDRQGNVTVRRVGDGAEICHLAFGADDCRPRLSPHGRFLLLGGAPRGSVWDLSAHEPRLILRDEASYASGAFSPDSRRLALAHADGSISLHELPSGGLMRRLAVGPVPSYLAFRPDGRQLALACRECAQVRDLETGKVCAEFRYPEEWGPWVAWHPDGRTLATVGGDRIVRLWDVATGKPTVQLEGFKNGGIRFTFNRAGDLLASNGWEATLRLWDPRTGQRLFQVRSNWAGGKPHFGPDDRLLAADVKDGKLRLWEVATSRAYRTLVWDPVLGKGTYTTPAISPRGRLLASGMRDGLGFWDCRTGAPLAFVRLDDADSIIFEASGALLTEGEGGPFRWPVRPDPAAPRLLRIGPPQRLPLPSTNGTQLACSRDGRVVASCDDDGALVWRRDCPGEPVRLRPHEDVRSVSVSPDGRWVATGSWWGTGVKVWDAATGRLVADLVPTQSQVGVLFSPDGKWLATAGATCRLWAVDSWQEGRSLGVTHGVLAFSPDARLLALETGQGAVRLLDLDTGREYARLEDPNQDRASSFNMAFSPDGTQLVVNGETQALHVWDLRAIREELAQRGLDWDLPPYPPDAEEKDAAPLRVAVDLGSLRDKAPPDPPGPK